MKHIKSYNKFNTVNEGWAHNIALSSALLLSSLVGFAKSGDPIDNIDKVKKNLTSIKDSGSVEIENLIDKNLKTLGSIEGVQKIINIDSIKSGNISPDNIDMYLSKLDSLDKNINLDSLNLNLDSLYNVLDKNLSKNIDSNLIRVKEVLKNVYNQDEDSLVKDLKEFLKSPTIKDGNSTYQIISISIIILIIGTILVIKLS